MGLSKTVAYRFERLAEVQRFIVVEECAEMARKSSDPTAWVEALMQSVNTKMAEMTEDSEVKRSAQEQLDLIADELTSKFVAVRRAA